MHKAFAEKKKQCIFLFERTDLQTNLVVDCVTARRIIVNGDTRISLSFEQYAIENCFYHDLPDQEVISIVSCLFIFSILSNTGASALCQVVRL